MRWEKTGKNRWVCEFNGRMAVVNRTIIKRSRNHRPKFLGIGYRSVRSYTSTTLVNLYFGTADNMAHVGECFESFPSVASAKMVGARLLESAS